MATYFRARLNDKAPILAVHNDVDAAQMRRLSADWFECDESGKPLNKDDFAMPKLVMNKRIEMDDPEYTADQNERTGINTLNGKKVRKSH